MATITGEIAIGRPVDVVFDCVADQRNEPRYNSRMVRAEKMTPGRVGVGTRFEATMMTGRRREDMVIELIEHDPPRRVSSKTTTAMADITGTITLEPAADGTVMRWSWDVRPKRAARLVAPVVAVIGRRQERTIWTNLKHYLEGQAPNTPS
jgi:hypothetical protein